MGLESEYSFLFVCCGKARKIFLPDLTDLTALIEFLMESTFKSVL